MEGITIQKSTALMFAGLVLAALFGAYIVFSTPGASGESTGAPKAAGDAAGGGAGIENGQGTGLQEIYIRALSNGAYDKQEVSVDAGVPVRLHFTADPNAGCGRQMVIYGLGVNAISRSGEEDVVDFVPNEPGTYEFNCGMRMWKPGKLVVV